MKSTLLVVGVFVALMIVGAIMASGPSAATIAADRTPTSTTTTEPPPEGIAIVRIDNGVFRPANLKIDLDEVWIVRWINDDPREYVMVDSDGNFEVTLAEGDTFEFDYSTLEPGIHRYKALIGFQRIPGSVDSRPSQ
jgi:hypothetical protein